MKIRLVSGFKIQTLISLFDRISPYFAQGSD